MSNAALSTAPIAPKLNRNRAARLAREAAAAGALVGERLISIDEVVARSGMCRAKIYNMIREAAFPAPAKLGNSSRWSIREVEAFIERALADRNLPAVAQQVVGIAEAA